MDKSLEDAHELIEEMTSNNYQWSNDRGMPMPKKASGTYDVDGITMLNAKVDSLVKMMGNMGQLNSISNPTLTCDFCGGAHMNEMRKYRASSIYGYLQQAAATKQPIF